MNINLKARFEEILHSVAPNYTYIDDDQAIQAMQQAYDTALQDTALNEELQLFSDERKRQINRYGYSDEHILQATEDYAEGELALAAASYLCSDICLNINNGYVPDILFPWPKDYFKPCPDDRIKELVKAGAMILAEIKRIKSLPQPPVTNKP